MIGHAVCCVCVCVHVLYIAAESPYLSPANGEPVLYINIEDHVSYATGKPNQAFQATMALLRSPVCGPARMHWGKAGWEKNYGTCFDGAKEYPRWCDFGCAVHQLDPKGKFAGMARGLWRWQATETASGQPVSDFGSCCTPGGFDYSRCSCANVGKGC